MLTDVEWRCSNDGLSHATLQTVIAFEGEPIQEKKSTKDSVTSSSVRSLRVVSLCTNVAIASRAPSSLARRFQHDTSSETYCSFHMKCNT